MISRVSLSPTIATKNSIVENTTFSLANWGFLCKNCSRKNSNSPETTKLYENFSPATFDVKRCLCRVFRKMMRKNHHSLKIKRLYRDRRSGVGRFANHRIKYLCGSLNTHLSQTEEIFRPPANHRRAISIKFPKNGT